MGDEGIECDRGAHRARAHLRIVVAAFVLAPGAARTADTLTAENTTNQWLVELSGKAADFRGDAKKARINYKERFAFSDLWNGVSIETAASNVDAIRSLPGVTAVYPNETCCCRTRCPT